MAHSSVRRLAFAAPVPSRLSLVSVTSPWCAARTSHRACVRGGGPRGSETGRASLDAGVSSSVTDFGAAAKVGGDGSAGLSVGTGGGGGGIGGGGSSYGGNGSGGGGGDGAHEPGGDGSWPGWRVWLWPVFAGRRYLAALDRTPLATKMVTAALLGALSDLIAQAIEARGVGAGERAGTDWRRVWALAAVGGLLTAPLFHALYEWLERALPLGGLSAGRRARNVALQLVVDQVVAAPAWLLAFFPMFDVAESGQWDGERIARGLRRDFLPSLRLTWTIFPVCQLLSFSLLPSNMRVLVLNVVDLGYTAGLSLLKHA